MPNTKQKTTIRLPRELHKQLRRITVEEETSFESIVTRFLTEEVDRYYLSEKREEK
jgi:predicted HicB family RNase H-like nuclease